MAFIDIITQGSLSLVAAFVILLLGLVLGRVISKIVERLLNELEINKRLRNKNKHINLEEITSSIVKYGIYLTSIILALNQLRISFLIFRVITALLILVILIFLILSIKDIIPNFISSLFLLRRSKIKINEDIELSNIKGKIIRTGWLETTIKTNDNNILVIPNFYLIKNIGFKK